MGVFAEPKVKIQMRDCVRGLTHGRSVAYVGDVKLPCFSYESTVTGSVNI